MRIVAANVSTTQSLPANGTVRVQFDRYLLPSSVTRQSVILLDSSNKPVDSPLVVYDPVAFTVSLSNSTGSASWLTPGQPYKVELLRPEESPTHDGLRAIDGAPLADDQSREIGFSVSSTLLPAAQAQEAAVSFCGDVYPVFVAKCGTGSPCHSSASAAQSPAASMVLVTPTGVEFTAISRVAQGSNTGARTGAGDPPGRAFGIDMPIVDPGDPGNSWMIYKTMLAAYPSTAPSSGQPLKCRNAAGALLSPTATGIAAVEPSDSERAVLSDYVLGREMPYPPAPGPPSYGTQALTFEERERLRLWMAQGAKTEACGACE